MSIKSLYPDIRPSLLLDFANAKQLDPRITFTRNSTATYVGRDGLIKTAGFNQPRFDHDPVTGESLGLLVEEERTNIVDNSTDFSAWSDGTSSGPNLTLRWLQDDVALAPDGTTTASKMIPSTQSDNQRIYKVIGATDQYLNQTLTISVFAKAGEYTKIFLRSDSGNDGYIYVDLTNGSVSNVGTDTITYSVVEYPNGWYRLSLTAVESDSSSGHVPWISIVNDSDTYSFAGDGSTDGLYIWGAQVEVGSFPTSYIPTSGSTVTRVRDAASITGTNFSDWYNPYEVSVVGEYRSFAGYEGNRSPASYPSPFTIDNTATTRLVMTYHRYDGQINAFVRSGAGDTVADLDIYSSASSVDYGSIKYAFASSNADGFSGIVNDGNIVTDTTVNMPTDVNRATIGGSYGSNTFTINGTIKKLACYPKRLTNNQLITLTK